MNSASEGELSCRIFTVGVNGMGQTAKVKSMENLLRKNVFVVKLTV